MDLAQYAAPTIGRTLGWGSAISAFELVDSHFYGKGSKEIVYLDITTNHAFESLGPWQDVKAVKVLSHPRTDLGFHITTRVPETTELGLATILIDVGLLAYQYRGWRLEQSTLPPEERLGIQHFVGQYVLPNLLESHLNVAMFNRLFCHLVGVAPANTTPKLSIALPSTMTFVDYTLEQIAETITRQHYRWQDLWATLPLPFGPHCSDVFVFPKQAPTRHARAFFAIVSLTYLDFLTSVELSFTDSINRDQQIELSRQLARLKSERWFQSVSGDLRPYIDPILADLQTYVERG
jgi:hypothetical protein